MKGCNHTVRFYNDDDSLELKYVETLCPDCQERLQEQIIQLKGLIAKTPNVKYFLALQHAYKKIVENKVNQNSVKLFQVEKLVRLVCENWLQFVSSAECEHCHGDCLWDVGMRCECQWSTSHE